MPDDLAAAMRAGGRECMDGTFKAIKGVGLARHPNFECLVVVIAAYIASSHRIASDHIAEINALRGFTSLPLEALADQGEVS
jgi:hypothetical protein